MHCLHTKYRTYASASPRYLLPVLFRFTPQPVVVAVVVQLNVMGFRVEILRNPNENS